MSLEAEQAVIGGLLINSAAIREIDLTPDEFMDDMNAEIFRAALALARERVPADMVTVTKRMGREKDAELIRYISELSRNTPSAANIGAYAGMVRETFRRRTAINIGQEMVMAVEREGMDAVDHAISRLMELGKSSRQYEFTIKEALKAAYDNLEAASRGESNTIPMGLRGLDESLGGLHPTDLIVIGARPAIGKTAFMLNLAMNAGCRVGIVSGEQPYDQIGTRALSRQSKVPLYKMRQAKMEADEWKRLSPAVEALTKSDFIRIMDRSGPSIIEVVRQARKWKHNFGIRALYVDYIQKLRGSDRRASKREQVDEVVSSLKDLARELEIPVVALAQVNRECENRTDKRPHVSDLKESGTIEQEADAIITLYRDEVYNPDTTQYPGIMECIVGKNRHGPTGRKDVIWNPDILEVRDMPEKRRDD